jgi:hypothetical protein
MAYPTPPGTPKPKKVTVTRKPTDRVTPGRARKTDQRLVAIRSDHPKFARGVRKGGFTVAEANRIKKRYRATQRRPHAPATPAAPPFDPLAPVTPQGAQQEVNAAADLQFRPQERAVRQEIANQAQDTANTGSYYDDYKKALAEATGRISAVNKATADEMQTRTNAVADLASAQSAQSDANLQRQADLLGRGQVSTPEGQQSSVDIRSQGTQAANRQRVQGAADTGLMEKRGATAVLAKAQALSRENARMRGMLEKKGQIAADKGTFKVAERGKVRESERSWAAIQKEFKLKSAAQKAATKGSKADRKLERQKLRTQQIVAGIYAAADKAGAQAQVKVAKINLQKGRISQRQYREITNIYKGLPAKGTSPAAKGTTGGAAKPGAAQGSGAGGTLAPWERDRINSSRDALFDAHAQPSDRRKAIDQLVRQGVPRRLALVAWNEYIKAEAKRQRNAEARAHGYSGSQ